jgi:hypothetical protein
MKVYLVFHGGWDEDIQRVKNVFLTKDSAVMWLDRYLDDVKGIHWVEEHEVEGFDSLEKIEDTDND